MRSTASIIAARVRAIPRTLLREVRLFWKFTRRDWSTTIIPTSIFTFAALKTRWPFSAYAAALSWGRCLLYFSLYIYTFCLVNQVAGVDEDRVNKPDRPIPSGVVSYRGALARWVALSAAFLGVGVWLGVFVWAAGWAVLTILHCLCGWDKHWFTKNTIIMTLGVLVELAAAWELVTPLTPIGWRWVLVLSGTIGATALLQDLRDVDGDRAVGRRTLPVVIGEAAARRCIGALFVIAPIVVHFALMSAAGRSSALACDIVLGAWSLVIAARTVSNRSPQADHATYMFYTYWYCALLLSAVVVI